MLVETTYITKSYPSEVKENYAFLGWFTEDGVQVTEKLLSKIVTYEEFIKGIGTIIDSGVFEINN